MAGHGEKLPRKQEDAIAALLAAPTVTAAAELVGIGERTLRRWLRDAAFLNAYRHARRKVVESAIGRIQNATGEAVDALRRNLTCGRAGDEIRAAVAILDHAEYGVELLDLTELMEELETQVANRAAG
jgi:hypothetical protein